MLTPFQAYYYCVLLREFKHDKMLIPVIADSKIGIYPHQIASANLTLKMFQNYSYLNNKEQGKGFLLCDEGGLGKTYTTMIVLATRFAMHGDKILVVVPHQLLFEWTEVFEDSFSVPYDVVTDIEKLEQVMSGGNESVILTSYNFAKDNNESFKSLNFDIVVYDEAHKIPKNKETAMYKAMYDIGDNAFKLLLTATPMENSILDLHSLISFIDGTILEDEETFYKKYFRKPELYSEIGNKIKNITFRTLREEVKTYINIPERIPISIVYDYDENESKLYKLLESYLALPEKKAFPNMDSYELTLMMSKNFSSSISAFKQTLIGIEKRLENGEETEESLYIKEMLKLCDKIKETSKTVILLEVLKHIFKVLKESKSNEKVIIFTENTSTLKYLYDVLNKKGYKDKVLTFDGRNSHINIKEEFQNRGKILITTDIASDGFNFTFAKAVINFDLPYNVLKVEQRVNRIQRTGQDEDVLIINFFNNQNFYDVRILELIKKRLLQFEGIMGLSQDFVGEFLSLEESFNIISSRRDKNKVLEDFEANKNLEEIEERRDVYEHILYTTFSKEVRDNVVITPDKVVENTSFLQDRLWDFTKYFFHGKQGFYLDEGTQSVDVGINIKSPFTGKALKGRRYSVLDESISKACRHGITGTLTKNISSEIMWKGIEPYGVLKIADCTPCKIALYEINIKTKSNRFEGDVFYRFVGVTDDGVILSDLECRRILEREVEKFISNGENVGMVNRHLVSNKGFYDNDVGGITDGLCTEYLTKINSDTSVEVSNIKDMTEYKIQNLERDINVDRHKIEVLTSKKEQSGTVIEKLEINKELSMLTRGLKQREQNVYLDKLRIQKEMDEFVRGLMEDREVECKWEFIFEVDARNDI